jgi:putative PIG3 family NAD(P)H quinone oxidoreductase
VKAIVAREPGPPDVLELREVESPKPRPDEVLIKVAAAGVNRPDLLQRQGHYQPPPGTSSIIGLEVSGTIAEVGEEISNWEVDDPCVALLAGGGYAEYVAAPTGQVVPPPLGVELVAAAGVIEIAATVYSNIELTDLADGDVFLVHGGAGGIGSFAIQYAKSLGATVITTAGSEDKLRYCLSIGADHAISYRGDWAAEVRAVANNGVNMILDIMGAKYLGDHVQLLAADGLLATIGMQGGRSGTLDLWSLMQRRGIVTGSLLRFRPVAEKAAICRGLVERIWPLIADSTIKLPPPTVFPLAEAAAAHARLESGDNIGKIILSVMR